MMKKLWVLFVATVVISMLVQGATASIYLRNPQVGDTVVFSGQGDSQGGPFTATINYQGGGNTTWTTFCVEHQQYIVNDGSTLYGMDPIDPWTMTNARTTQNLVTDQAKWLFHEFNAGALNAFNASRVQDAIWSYVKDGTTAAPLFTGVVDPLLVAVADSMPTGWDSSNVRIMNPYREGNPGGPNAQSVLYEIPEPVSLIVWSLLGGLGLVYAWRKRKTA